MTENKYVEYMDLGIGNSGNSWQPRRWHSLPELQNKVDVKVGSHEHSLFLSANIGYFDR